MRTTTREREQKAKWSRGATEERRPSASDHAACDAARSQKFWFLKKFDRRLHSGCATPVQHPVTQHVALSPQVTVLVWHAWVDRLHDWTVHRFRTGAICVVVPPPPRQSMSAQHAPQTPAQQSGVLPGQAVVLTHL